VNDFEVVKARLQEINRSYHEKSRSYDTYYEQYQRAAQEILLKRQALDAFNEAIILFDEQVFPYLQCCGSRIRCLFDPWIRDPG
jgi:phosphoinositide-3-kinase regulatory subunit